jgi:hypothetical protein
MRAQMGSLPNSDLFSWLREIKPKIAHISLNAKKTFFAIGGV